MQIRNEFAVVDLTIRESEGGSVLQVRDILRGTTITLDALELEALTRLRHADFGPLVDPSFTGLVGTDDVGAGSAGSMPEVSQP